MRQKNAAQQQMQHMSGSQSGYFSPGGSFAGSASPLASPLATPPTPLQKTSSRLNSPLASASSASKKFGGQSFGTPKPHHLRSSVAASTTAAASSAAAGTPGADIADDLPPVESIYDSGAASPFAFQMPLNTVSNAVEMSEPASPAPGKSSQQSQSLSEDQQPSSVMVFGFPPELTHAVVSHFSKFGRILEHLSTEDADVDKSLPPAPVETGKNWLKITYTTPMAANRALMENGHMLGGQSDYILGCVAVPQTTSNNNTSSATGMKRSSARSGLSSVLNANSEGETSSYASTISRKRAPVADNSARLFSPATPSSSNLNGMTRTTSMPVGFSSTTAAAAANGSSSTTPGGRAGGRKLQVRGAEGIFREKERRGMAHSVTIRGLASRFMAGGGGAGDGSKRTGEASAETERENKRVKSSSSGWVGSLSRKASEMIFGWDDL